MFSCNRKINLMKKETRYITLALVVLCAILWLIYAYGEPYLEYRQYPGFLFADYFETNNYGCFQIDPATILDSIDKGETEIFSPEPRACEDIISDGNILYKGTYLWNQADYLKIANSLNGFVWKDTLEGWSIYKMFYQADCQEDPSLRNADIIYYKTTFDKGRILYATRVMEVEPAYINVEWGGGAFYPHPLSGWKGMDVNRLKITAEDALRIAEENGGREARAKFDNQCYIDLLLFSEKYPGWLVSYNGTYEHPEFQIDPYDGSILK